jgi:hypothetical protein
MKGVAASPAQIAAFFSRYSPEIAARGRAIRVQMRRLLPGWSEFVYDNYAALVFGYGPTERPSDAMFSIAMYPRWVRLFFLQNGAELDDPTRLLSGNGTRIRSLVLASAEDLGAPAVRALMQQSMKLERVAAPAGGRVKTTVRAVSAKQRPRRAR